MTAQLAVPPSTQLYQVFIKASPQRVWEAITTPEFIRDYFHGASITVDAGRLIALAPDGSTWMDEDVYEFDPPRRLSHRWRSLYNPECAEESGKPGDLGDRIAVSFIKR